jgi:hypothetical protein
VTLQTPAAPFDPGAALLTRAEAARADALRTQRWSSPSSVLDLRRAMGSAGTVDDARRTLRTGSLDDGEPTESGSLWDPITSRTPEPSSSRVGCGEPVAGNVSSRNTGYQAAVQDFRTWTEQCAREEDWPCRFERSAAEMLTELGRVEVDGGKFVFDASQMDPFHFGTVHYQRGLQQMGILFQHPEPESIVCDDEKRLVRDAFRLLVVNADLIRGAICAFVASPRRTHRDENRLHDELYAQLAGWLGLDASQPVRVVRGLIREDGTNPETYAEISIKDQRFIVFNSNPEHGILVYASNLRARAKERRDDRDELGAIVIAGQMLLHELLHLMGVPDFPGMSDAHVEDGRDHQDRGESVLHMIPGLDVPAGPGAAAVRVPPAGEVRRRARSPGLPHLPRGGWRPADPTPEVRGYHQVR